jgi:hypothetical protein
VNSRYHNIVGTLISNACVRYWSLRFERHIWNYIGCFQKSTRYWSIWPCMFKISIVAGIESKHWCRWWNNHIGYFVVLYICYCIECKGVGWVRTLKNLLKPVHFGRKHIVAFQSNWNQWSSSCPTRNPLGAQRVAWNLWHWNMYSRVWDYFRAAARGHPPETETRFSAVHQSHYRKHNEYNKGY